MIQHILLLAAGQGSLLSIALLSAWFKSDYLRFYLGIIFFVISVELWYYWGINIDYIQNNPKFPYWSLGSYLLLAPSMYVVLKYLVCSGFSAKKPLLLWLIPGLIEILINVSKFYINYFFKIDIFSYNHPLWAFLTQQFPILWVLIVLVVSFHKKPHTKNFFIFYGLFIVLTLLWIIDYLFPDTIFTFLEMILICVLFVFGYIAYFYPRFFDNSAPTASLDQKFKHYNHQEHLTLLNTYVKEKRMYTQQGITLLELSKHIGVSPKYLSYLINKYYKMSFRNFINGLRVQEVIDKIEKGELKDKTLLALAMDAGFSSKSNFNAVFKSHTGKNPSAYKIR